jgi:hypothetical protein
MHINVHVALGIIIATIAGQFIDLTFWYFGFIVFFSIFPDFDIIFKKFAFEKNHRNLFPHSIYIPSFMLIIGIILNNIIMIFCAIGYFIHLFADTFDWGLDLFFSKKTVGLSLLLTLDERINLPTILEKYPIPQFFFIHRYYHTLWVILTEILVFGAMMILLLGFEPLFWYFIFIYLAAVLVHFVEYNEIKHQHNGGEKRIPLIPH